MKIGPYETLGELGRGGMGIVFRARSPDGREVAIKVLLKVEAEKLARFERERRLIGGFTARDGFVPLLDSGLTSQGPYLVMPFLEGGTLRGRLERGPFGIGETLELGRALAVALGRAHERGIVHRDMKPENVLFNGDGHPLVADLGLAKHFDALAPGASQTVSLSVAGALRGTAGYMAPEQMLDAKSAGPPADVFALGAILYECLAGRPAFEGENFVAVLANVHSGSFAPLLRARPDLPPWLAAAIERALARDANERFRDGRDLARALEVTKAGRRPSPRTLVALLAAGLGAAVFTGALTWLLRAPEVSPSLPPPSHAPPTGSPRLPDAGESTRRAQELLDSATDALLAGRSSADVAPNVSRAIALVPRSSLPRGPLERLLRQLRRRVEREPPLEADSDFIIEGLRALRLARLLGLELHPTAAFVDSARDWARHFRGASDDEWTLEGVDAFLLASRDARPEYSHYAAYCTRGASALRRAHPELAAEAREAFEAGLKVRGWQARPQSLARIEFLASDGDWDAALQQTLGLLSDKATDGATDIAGKAATVLCRAGWPPRHGFDQKILDGLLAKAPDSAALRALYAFSRAGRETDADIAALEAATTMQPELEMMIVGFGDAGAAERDAALRQLGRIVDGLLADPRRRARILVRLGRVEEAASVLRDSGGDLAKLADDVRTARTDEDRKRAIERLR